MQKNETLPKALLILISLIQGLLLLLLHQAIELEFWPHSSPEWLFCFYSIVFVGPTMLLLGLRNEQQLIILKWVVPFTLLSGLLGYYVGYQALPLPNFRFESLIFGLVFTMSIATFKALMYVQQFASGEKFSYSQLFRWSWRNFLTLGLAGLFACSTWGVLMLWGGLFKAINIEFFYDLFTKPWFYYPIISLANGFGIIIFRNLTNVIDTITRLQQALMKYLLVMLVLVSILFVFALPFTGLTPLWDSGGSALIFWMQALMLFFVNAVYQDDPTLRPYHVWLHRFIYAGILLLPIYSAISLYGLHLRIDQYGWSIDRCWASFIWTLLTCISIGYFWGIVRYWDDWIHQLSRVNVVMGLVMLFLLLAVNSPLLDFRVITLASQLSRLEANEIEVDQLDLNYFKNNLARPGYLALQEIRAEYEDSNPLLSVKISNLYKSNNEEAADSSEEEILSSIEVISGEIPEKLGTSVFRHISDNHRSISSTRNYYLVETDLNDDGDSEFILVQEQTYRTNLHMFYFEEGEWLKSPMVLSGTNTKFAPEFFDALRNKPITTHLPRWNDVQIGSKKFRVSEK